VERNASWVLTVRFAPRSVAAVPPGWQERSIRNREYLPLFLGLGGLILFAGAGGFVVFALNHRHVRIDTPTALASPPDSLRPALAGTLISAGASAGWGPVLGATMELARRGALTIRSVEKAGLFKSQEVRVTAGPTPADAAPHERVLLELLFTDKHGARPSVTFSELARTFASSSRWKRLKEAILSDLRAARLLDGDRDRTRGRVMVTGLVILLSSIAGFIVSVALFDLVGEPVLLVPISLLVVGVVGMITGASLSPLSEEGYRCAERWRAFKRTLGDNARTPTGATPGADRLEHWLPYAVALGAALGWMKRLQRQGVTVGPSWLGAVSREGDHGPASIGATVAILSAGSSAGAHAGFHAAGAAGGGASSAG
jgi:VIT1/CCC1 family predicted Fe2+/Mn2+ transporter